MQDSPIKKTPSSFDSSIAIILKEVQNIERIKSEYEKEVEELLELRDESYSDVVELYVERLKEVEFTMSALRHALFKTKQAEKITGIALDSSEKLMEEVSKDRESKAPKETSSDDLRSRFVSLKK